MISMLLVLVAMTPLPFPKHGNNDELTSFRGVTEGPRRVLDNYTRPIGKRSNVRDAHRNAEKVKKLLDTGKLVTGEDFECAAFVFQHGVRPEDYLMAHILAMTALVRGNAKARWISAATLDQLPGVHQEASLLRCPIQLRKGTGEGRHKFPTP